ncbi:MAG: helix-turn-helix domain-containing protein [Spirochaetia bacterium]|nr:helix-turn-helix domain-containing protein [Spirochaetia bacterium]
MLQTDDLRELYDIRFDQAAHNRLMAESFIAEGPGRRFSEKAAEIGVVAFFLDHAGLRKIYPHRHQFFEMVLVVRGRARHKVGGELMTVSEGEILLMSHQRPHSYELIGEPFEIVNVCFDPSLLYPGFSLDHYQGFRLFRPFFGPSDTSVRFRPEGKTFLRFLDLAFRLSSLRNGKTDFFHKEALQTGLLSILQSLSSAYEAANPSLPEENQFLKKVLETIPALGSEKISLARLAKSFGLSPFTFSRRFKKMVGESLPVFVNRMKIEKSKKLLRESELAVTDVALECGFENLSHFHRLFKAATGLTPGVFQKREASLHTGRAIKSK